MTSKNVRCLVVDDEPLAIKLLEKHIEQLLPLQLVATCGNALEAFDRLRHEAVDLLFLDIQMPGIDGLEFARSLRNPPSIIFTTAYREYAVESYELDVVDYLLKPITLERFFRSVNKYLTRVAPPKVFPTAVERVEIGEASFLYVNTNRRHVKILFEEVQYVESLKDYVKIHLPTQEVITKDKISEFEQKLPDYFLRVHRSYLVNAQKITAYTKYDVEVNGVEIPIGISFKKEVMAFLEKREGR